MNKASLSAIARRQRCPAHFELAVSIAAFANEILAAFLLSSCWLLAQNESFPVIDFGGGIVQQQTVNSINLGQVPVSNTQYYWNITRAANGDKTFTFSAMHCVYAIFAVVLE